MQPSEIGQLTFKQFEGYMQNIEELSKMEKGDSSGGKQENPPVVSNNDVKKLMASKGIRIPK